MRGNQAYFLGRAARAMGKPESTCPYPQGSHGALAWLEGWTEIDRSPSAPALAAQAPKRTPVKQRRPKSHGGRSWTPEEIQLVTSLKLKGASLAEMAKATGRTVNSVSSLLIRLHQKQPSLFTKQDRLSRGPSHHQVDR